MLPTGSRSMLPWLLLGRLVPQTPAHGGAMRANLINPSQHAGSLSTRQPSPWHNLGWSARDGGARHYSPLKPITQLSKDHHFTVAMATFSTPPHAKTHCRLSKNKICCLFSQTPLQMTAFRANPYTRSACRNSCLMSCHNGNKLYFSRLIQFCCLLTTAGWPETPGDSRKAGGCVSVWFWTKNMEPT